VFLRKVDKDLDSEEYKLMLEDHLHNEQQNYSCNELSSKPVHSIILLVILALDREF